jgi:hypothetical protein
LTGLLIWNPAASAFQVMSFALLEDKKPSTLTPLLQGLAYRHTALGKPLPFLIYVVRTTRFPRVTLPRLSREPFSTSCGPCCKRLKQPSRQSAPSKRSPYIDDVLAGSLPGQDDVTHLEGAIREALDAVFPRGHVYFVKQDVYHVFSRLKETFSRPNHPVRSSASDLHRYVESNDC